MKRLILILIGCLLLPACSISWNAATSHFLSDSGQVLIVDSYLAQKHVGLPMRRDFYDSSNSSFDAIIAIQKDSAVIGLLMPIYRDIRSMRVIDSVDPIDPPYYDFKKSIIDDKFHFASLAYESLHKK